MPDPVHEVRPSGQAVAPGGLKEAFDRTLNHWREAGLVGRLWQRDASVWTGGDEHAWLGWLDAVQLGRDALPEFSAIGREAAAASHVVVLGMGGSSLAPWVLGQTFGHVAGHPELRVIDSMDPAQIRSVEAALDLSRTLFIVASKSGGTVEPLSLYAYFAERLRAAGVSSPGRQFLAITDPGTSLEARAAAEGFRHVVHGRPDVGGRFSALTAFGLVPAAIMGIDVGSLLDHVDAMVRACGPSVPAEENPGAVLGILLGTAAAAGRDKMTLSIAPALEAIGAWLEQLVAESTGKMGRGIVPVDGEPLGAPEEYGADRVFVRIDLSGDPDHPGVARLQEAGHPVVRISVPGPMSIGQEFFRWEIATAVASAVLRLNAFDQPDVEAAKVATRAFMRPVEGGQPPAAEAPAVECDGLRFHVNESFPLAGTSAEALVAAHVGQLRAGDYFAINAFLAMSAVHDAELQALRRLVHHHSRVATTVGYGPRFLHSTGQLHKGGPNTGVFLVLVSDDGEDMPVPGTGYSFGALKRAQALGDCQVLAERGRRVLRVDIGGDTLTGLRRLRAVFEDALATGDVR